MKLIKLKDNLETIIDLEKVSILRFKEIQGSNPYFEITMGFADSELLHIRYEEYESNRYKEDKKYLNGFVYRR